MTLVILHRTQARRDTGSRDTHFALYISKGSKRSIDIRIDVLKVDRSVVQDSVIDPTSAAITRAIIDLAHSLGVYVTAEGVETIDQFSFLGAKVRAHAGLSY